MYHKSREKGSEGILKYSAIGEWSLSQVQEPRHVSGIILHSFIQGYRALWLCGPTANASAAGLLPLCGSPFIGQKPLPKVSTAYAKRVVTTA